MLFGSEGEKYTNILQFKKGKELSQIPQILNLLKALTFTCK